MLGSVYFEAKKSNKDPIEEGFSRDSTGKILKILKILKIIKRKDSQEESFSRERILNNLKRFAPKVHS